MKSTDRNHETSVALLLVALGMYASIMSFNIAIRTPLLISARIFPAIISVLFTLIAVGHFIGLYAGGGRVSPAMWYAGVKTVFLHPERRRVLATILLLAVYIFLGLPFFGFFRSSIVFMLFVLLLFVRRNRLISIMYSFAYVGVLFLIFVRFFRIPIR